MAALLTLPSPALADGPMEEASFAPNSVSMGDQTGFVNVLNGSVTVPIEIGPTYAVNEALSYRLTLVYSSNLRRWTTHFSAPGMNKNRIRGRSPVGSGWVMHFGRIASKDPTYVDRISPYTDHPGYQAPDGSWHTFFDGTGDPKCSGFTSCWLTRDNSQIRAVDGGAGVGWRLWTPDGIERRLGHYVTAAAGCAILNPESACDSKSDYEGWYTTSILDPLHSAPGNVSGSVTIAYAGASNSGSAASTRMAAVSDSVNLANPTMTFEDTDGDHLIDRIRVKTSDTEATYNLQYEFRAPVASGCPQPYGTDGRNAALLKKVSVLPGGGKPALSWDFSYAAVTDALESVDLPGGLAKATYAWACVEYSWGHDPACTPQQCCPMEQFQHAVCNKRVGGSGSASCADPQCDDAGVDCWTYERGNPPCAAPELYLPAVPCGCPVISPPTTDPDCLELTNPYLSRVTLPGQPTSSGVMKRNVEKHYFSTGCGSIEPNGLEKKVEYFDGDDPAALPVRLSEFVHEWDSGVEPIFIDTRQKSTTTYFGFTGPQHLPDPSRRTQVERSGWDGLGHFQSIQERTTEGGFSGSDVAERQTEVAYLPLLGGQLTEWTLNLPKQRVVKDAWSGGNVVAKTELHWDAFGRLLHAKRYALPAGSPLPDWRDVEVYYGWVSPPPPGVKRHELECTVWCGGDPLQTGSAMTCPAKDANFKMTTSCGDSSMGCGPSNLAQNYNLFGGYTRGHESWRQYHGIGWNMLDRHFYDAGDLKDVRDPRSRYYKKFTYDLVGRTTKVEYADQPLLTEERRLDLDWQAPEQLFWRRIGAGGTAADDPRGTVKYDAYGRRRQTRMADPDSTQDFVQSTRRDAFGNVTEAGDWCKSAAADPNCSKAE